MPEAEINLPVRIAASPHFRKCYGLAHLATEKLARISTEEGALKKDVTREDSRSLVKSLTEALCAAREFDNILGGVPTPKRGEA